MAPNIPKEQWAMVIEKSGGPVDYKKIPVQKPGPDEVLINIKYSGVCHTDLHVRLLCRLRLVVPTDFDPRLSMATGHCPLSFLSSGATKVLVLL